MSKNIDQKSTITRKNTGESTQCLQFHSPESGLLTYFSTPIYNMGVTAVDPRLNCDEFTFPRKLDNVKMVLTEKGNVPILHSVSCDEYGIAAHDWVTFSFCQSTLGQEYFSVSPEEAESSLTYGIETFLDHHLYEIFGFGLEKKRDRGMHNYKYAYEMQDMLGMVLYGHSSKKISVQINGSGCALARKGWQLRLYKWLTSYERFFDPQTGIEKVSGCVNPKITRCDLAYDDFEGKYITVDIADHWDDLDGFWCGGRAPKIEKPGSWKRPNGKGRSFCIGDRTSGKYCRFYERGKKEGSPLSPWTRAEVEFKSKDRYIPLDILLSPSQYFLGAYPCFEWLAQQLEKDFVTPEKTEVVKKTSQINWDRSMEIVREQFGKYIRQYAKIIESDQLIAMLSSPKDEVPKRLKFSHAAVMQSIRLKQPIKSSMDACKPTASLEEMPLFVGVAGVNNSAYKEFINANAI
ncbi:replication initiation factor domain-containing protein [Acinetobacter sp. ANC 7200]|uniref:replication initiation factor domain-containing protein n=1 Tax=Acinetobacter amyesii TaxID=2942470 RepID=UPI0020BF0B8B|nr:replication initiation factor domain-containing protein [Acinetobacter amyesii]MCL6244045.1 replication initiation factor domain-containing protein [Acinetobacter amyesii]